ncbi:uncharacterized protein H6S33_003213 [Morchella sextelata]|uniref:uncharacterized protein n=1 Tax=Morchella sextelata TaxID=1174677 RepID=UPI001D03D38D|nr:uncharacterized protein H6S33_003213 [Morchella sextelata]KAH0607225.1 hypothetical protein H6S33_003213 [Morchella sextelata]
MRMGYLKYFTGVRSWNSKLRSVPSVLDFSTPLALQLLTKAIANSTISRKMTCELHELLVAIPHCLMRYICQKAAHNNPEFLLTISSFRRPAIAFHYPTACLYL